MSFSRNFFILLFIIPLIISCDGGGGGGGSDNSNNPSSTPVLPTIVSVSPASGPASGGTQVTVTGTNFVGSVSVTLGGLSVLNLQVSSTTSLNFTVPAGSLGFAEIVVNTDNGSSGSEEPPLGFTRVTENWRLLTASGGTPPGRFFGKTVYDPVRQRVLLFGGEAFDSVTFETIYFGDVWALDLSSPTLTAASWIPLTPDPGTSGIGSFTEMAVVYDSIRDRVLLTEGYNFCPPFPDPCITIGASVYALTFSSSAVTDGGTWSLLTNTSVDIPADRLTPAATFDPINDRLVMFGGFDPVSFTGTNGFGQFNDTWAFNLSGDSAGAWEEITAFTGTVPTIAEPSTSSLNNPSMIFDPIQARILSFGGFTDTDIAFGVGELAINTTYEFSVSPTSNSAWDFTPLVSGALPKESNAHSGVFDSVDQRLVIHGGFSGFGIDPLDETWVLDLSQPVGTWTIIPGSLGPAVENHMMAYDSLFNRTILFGGSSVSAGNSDETWVFELE